LQVDLTLKNTKMLLEGKIVRAGLAVEAGKIIKIAKDTNLPDSSQEIDAKGHIILPGLIDAHVHLRDQELAYKEDFYTGTAAAANGGVTCVLDMPKNKPVTMDTPTLRERMSVAAKKIIVDVGFYSEFPNDINEIRNIVREGAKAFKLYMSEKIGGLDPDDDEALVKAFSEARKMNVPVCVHAEDKQLLESALTKMMKKKDNDIEAYLKVHSPDAEFKAINRAIEIARKSKVKLHFCHVSTAKGIQSIKLTKQTGISITCEVTPQHLLLTSNDMKSLGAISLTNPPLRSDSDVRSLWSSIEGDIIDILASDHAPHSLDEKLKSEIWEVAPGIAGLETLLPLMLTQVNKGILSLPKLVQMTSERPAKIFGIKNKGELKEGYSADFVIVDLEKEWKIDASKFYSKAKFSPFDGWEVKGKPVKTFVDGHLVMDNGEITSSPGEGRIIRQEKVLH
jgi:dihydroorotase